MRNEERVLFVGAEVTTGRKLVRALSERGWRADWCESTESALFAMEESAYDLVLLDWKMPGISGTEACRALRLRSPDVPIVVYTIAEELEGTLAAFQAGADDYVFKSAHPDELCARMSAAVRRAAKASRAAAISSRAYLDLAIDLKRYRLYWRDVLLPATPNEIRFLRPLVEAKGARVPKWGLIEEIYGAALPANPLNSLKNLAAHVQKLLEPTGIALVNGGGSYSLALDVVEDVEACAPHFVRGGGGLEKNNLVGMSARA